MSQAASLQRAAADGAAVLRAAVASGELPGAAFAVATADEGTVLSAVFGLADVAGERAVTDRTPFCLASTTKPISTTVLAALVERGALGLDDPIDAHVPEMPSASWAAGSPTVRQIATHTAGLGVHHRFFYADERPPIPVVDAVRTLARPVHPIGLQWRYSNLGYGVLQLAIERTAGATMTELVQQHVFGPLGMHDSSWGGPLGPAGAAVRHLSADEAYPGYVTDHPPASEAWCSITDLVRFGLAHARASLLAADSHATIVRPTAPRQPDGAAYALGWVTRDYGDVRVLVHGGRMGGVGAHLTVVPSLGLVVAALANTETERLAEAVATVLAAAIDGYAPPTPAPPWTAGAAHPSLASRWEGVATLGDDDLPVVLDAAGDRITLRVVDAVAELAMPHVQPDGVFAHASLQVPHELVPERSICHLDALPVTMLDGSPRPVADGERADVLLGALVSAQYPGRRRRRQGDAITASLRLHRA